MHLQSETSVFTEFPPAKCRLDQAFVLERKGGSDRRLARNMREGFEISFLRFNDLTFLSLVCTVPFFFLITCDFLNDKNYLYMHGPCLLVYTDLIRGLFACCFSMRQHVKISLHS